MATKVDKCLICKTKLERDRTFWIYLWKKKQGFCCEECGHAIHNAGYKVLASITEILKTNGVEYIYSKEKFGYYQLHATVITPDQLKLSEALFADARERFPEFSFDFHANLQHTMQEVR